MVREPAVAGYFYPGTKTRLEGDLDSLIVPATVKIDAVGAVVPHAGYVYSGHTAGKVYGRLNPVDTYIILSPNHTGLGEPFSLSDEKWNTPLGSVDIDRELSRGILKRSGLVRMDEAAHLQEHSIEVQVPFIQKISPGASIVPITVQAGAYPALEEVACAIADAISDSRKKTCIIASSDMTHYESRDKARVKDRHAIDRILEIDPEGLMETVESERITMCGYAPTAIMLMTARRMGAEKTELVDYSDSGTVTGDTDQVVGYAGVIIY